MAFERVLDAAIDLLRRRRRVTHRLLQREFQLDDAALSDLRHELVRGQRVAREEGTDVLVWRGEHTTETVASHPGRRVDGASADLMPDGSDADPDATRARRQITVMFCDLVGSTDLAATLAPEDFRDLMQRYQHTCADALAPLGGHIAQYLGDGILAYFGYPQARPNDAERAVLAALALVRAVGDMAPSIQRHFAVDIAVRVGIHSGLVVFGDMGGSDRRERLALGEAPNLAAHIQACAEPGTVLVSEDTYRLLPAGFVAHPHAAAAAKLGRLRMRLLRVERAGDGDGDDTGTQR